DDRAAEHGEQRPRQDTQPERADLGLGEQQARAIGAQAVVRGVAERQEAGVAVEQVEAHGEQAEDQHLRGQGLVGHEERKDREEEREGEDRGARHGAGEGAHPRHSASPSSPKMPLGRTRSTTAITTNTMISASLGAKKVVRPTTWPIMIPATTAPRRLPMPPTTTTTNDSRP